VHTSADNQGEGFSYDITLSNADLAKMLYGSFDYEIVSGTYATGDATVYVYDVTNSTLIQPAGYSIQNGVGKFKHIYSFQSDSVSLSYRICFHIATTTATAWTMALDNMQLGPAVVSYGAPVTDMISWTPTGTWSTNTTYTGFKRRVGDNGEYSVKVALSGAPTAADLYINLPSGEVIDTAKLVSAADPADWLGEVFLADTGTDRYIGNVCYGTTTSVRIRYLDDAAGAVHIVSVSDTTPFTFANTDFITIKWKVPLSVGHLLYKCQTTPTPEWSLQL
jgi:hypothetical protein